MNTTTLSRRKLLGCLGAATFLATVKSLTTSNLVFGQLTHKIESWAFFVCGLTDEQKYGPDYIAVKAALGFSRANMYKRIVRVRVAA